MLEFVSLARAEAVEAWKAKKEEGRSEEEKEVEEPDIYEIPDDELQVEIHLLISVLPTLATNFCITSPESQMLRMV